MGKIFAVDHLFNLLNRKDNIITIVISLFKDIRDISFKNYSFLIFNIFIFILLLYYLFLFVKNLIFNMITFYCLFSFTSFTKNSNLVL